MRTRRKSRRARTRTASRPRTADAGTQFLADPVTVTCGAAPIELPRGAGTTILHLASGTTAAAKISVAGRYGDVPARAYILVDEEIEGSALTVGCRDATSVTIMGVSGGPV